MNRTHAARIVLALVLVAVCTTGGQAQQAVDPQALEKRIAALEASQRAILKELQEIKALLQSKLPANPTPPAPAPSPFVSIENAPTRGESKAKVTIVEFSDFECPFCGRYTRDTYGQIQREYVDAGAVRYVFRNLPLENIHPQAFGAAVAGECARAQGKFWEMHDRMFSNQRALAHAGLLQSAQAIGLDVAAFEKCLASDAPAKKVRQDLADAAALGANATPAFFVGVQEKDGRIRVLQRVVGAKTFPAFKAMIDSMLESPGLK
jgi:protein-disulfide isomerase